MLKFVILKKYMSKLKKKCMKKNRGYVQCVLTWKKIYIKEKKIVKMIIYKDIYLYI